MKILGVSGYFELPDDFNGTFSDALRLIADYHDNEGIENPNRERVPESNLHPKKLWEEFLLNAVRGNRLTMEIAMKEWRENEKDWTDIDELS